MRNQHEQQNHYHHQQPSEERTVLSASIYLPGFRFREQENLRARWYQARCYAQALYPETRMQNHRRWRNSHHQGHLVSITAETSSSYRLPGSHCVKQTAPGSNLSASAPAVHCRHLFFCPNARQSIIYFYKFGIMRNLWNYENSLPDCTSDKNERLSISEKYLSGKKTSLKLGCLNV